MKGGEFKSLKDLRPDMKGISLGEGLKKKLSSTIEKDLKQRKKLSTIDQGSLEVRSRDKLTKKETEALLTRHLLGLAVELRKSEFDILVTLKVVVFGLYLAKRLTKDEIFQTFATVLQIEVKTYPQELGTLKEKGLR